MTSNGRTGCPDGLWCITSFFNFYPSGQRLVNYRAFRRALGLPLITVELSLNRKFELNSGDADILYQVSDADLMWQKERLLNLALPRLPSDCEYVVWLDADIRFVDTNWPERAIDTLQHADVIQPFSSVRHLSPATNGDSQSHAELFTQNSVAEAMRQGVSGKTIVEGVTRRDSVSSSPGYAWMTRRSLLESIGFYDCCIVGGGDTAWFGGCVRAVDAVIRLHQMNAAQADRYHNWCKLVADHPTNRIGVLEGSIEHFWHGSMASRRTQQRHDGLSAFNFDPDSDLMLGVDGCWKWARDNYGLRDYLKEYVSSRETQNQ